MSAEVDAATQIFQIAVAGGAWGLVRYGFTRIDPTKDIAEQFDVKKFAPTLIAAVLIGVIVAATGITAPAAGAIIDPYAPVFPVLVDLAIAHVRKKRAASRSAPAA